MANLQSDMASIVGPSTYPELSSTQISTSEDGTALKTDDREMTPGQWAGAVAIGVPAAALIAALTAGLMTPSAARGSWTNFFIFFAGWSVPMTAWASALISQPGVTSGKSAQSDRLNQALASAFGDLLIFLVLFSVIQAFGSGMVAMPLWPVLLFALVNVALRYWLLRRRSDQKSE